MRFCPSWPLALPRTAPSGAGERRQRRADSIGLAARMKASAPTLCRLPAPSLYSTPLTCPPSLTSRQACALKRRRQRPVSSARRSVVTAGEAGHGVGGGGGDERGGRRLQAEVGRAEARGFRVGMLGGAAHGRGEQVHV